MLKSELCPSYAKRAFQLTAGDARRVTASSLEAFIVRLYREKNTAGFLKAFSDEPEHITSGMSPLKNIMKELQVRTVHIYPRYAARGDQRLEA
jgi:DNA excision repair protein ERCC-4